MRDVNIHISDDSCDEWGAIDCAIEDAAQKAVETFCDDTPTTRQVQAAAKYVWHEARKFAEWLRPTDYRDEWVEGDPLPETTCCVTLTVDGVEGDWQGDFTIG